uniref:F-box domain-containing protein n=1 Tax=Chromera velia CCMP2878 TaxID=1169474 RepID=A0A0G4F8R8_9ALVE|eukprot:Cvel_15804.t1-p1 / transcript=Cvel_15804.t1 / gene=Cvel_15804 / organism=Chromera_velia_CCMP2878 / gene_product=hypothetical protein / transcript_product=hypothetical protein / location=Cvel_scaffold1187:1357-6161(-) / protein_length=646 / sequence_SO=supercontig / SO=protein_coding / is_pseudo=false
MALQDPVLLSQVQKALEKILTPKTFADVGIIDARREVEKRLRLSPLSLDKVKTDFAHLFFERVALLSKLSSSSSSSASKRKQRRGEKEEKGGTTQGDGSEGEGSECEIVQVTGVWSSSAVNPPSSSSSSSSHAPALTGAAACVPVVVVESDDEDWELPLRFADLPEETYMVLLPLLELHEILRCFQVCKALGAYAARSALWRLLLSLCRTRFPRLNFERLSQTFSEPERMSLRSAFEGETVSSVDSEDGGGGGEEGEEHERHEGQTNEEIEEEEERHERRRRVLPDALQPAVSSSSSSSSSSSAAPGAARELIEVGAGIFFVEEGDDPGVRRQFEGEGEGEGEETAASGSREALGPSHARSFSHGAAAAGGAGGAQQMRQTRRGVGSGFGFSRFRGKRQKKKEVEEGKQKASGRETTEGEGHAGELDHDRSRCRNSSDSPTSLCAPFRPFLRSLVSSCCYQCGRGDPVRLRGHKLKVPICSDCSTRYSDGSAAAARAERRIFICPAHAEEEWGLRRQSLLDSSLPWGFAENPFSAQFAAMRLFFREDVRVLHFRLEKEARLAARQRERESKQKDVAKERLKSKTGAKKGGRNGQAGPGPQMRSNSTSDLSGPSSSSSSSASAAAAVSVTRGIAKSLAKPRSRKKKD